MTVTRTHCGPAPPAIYAFWVYVAYGGLMFYGPDVIDPYLRAAGYIQPTRCSKTLSTHVAAPAQVSYWHGPAMRVAAIDVGSSRQSGLGEDITRRAVVDPQPT